MPVKVAGGVLPLTMLVNGVSVGEIDSRRQRLVEPPGPGFARLTVIDATGRGGHSCHPNSIKRLPNRLSGLSGFIVCGTDGRDLCPPPIWSSRASRRTGSIRAAGLPACLTLRPPAIVGRSLFLLVCGLVLFLPGFFNIPPIDRDEARFAQATKQMVESDDFVDIRFQDDVRYKKPVGIYWMQAAVVETASALGLPRAQVRIWLYRIPSLIGAIGAVLLTYWTALAFVTRRGAILAALMMCSSVLLGVEARLAKTDAMLLLTVVAAMGAMARVYLSWQRGEDPVRPPWSWPAIFWTALAGGILLKGPLILMFVGLTIVTLAILDRSAAWLWRLRPVWGLMWMLVLVLPWFVAIFWRAGETFFTNSLGGDMLASSPRRNPMARRPASIWCCSGSRSGRARRWRAWRRRRCGGRGASPARSICWRG